MENWKKITWWCYRKMLATRLHKIYLYLGGLRATSTVGTRAHAHRSYLERIERQHCTKILHYYVRCCCRYRCVCVWFLVALAALALQQHSSAIAWLLTVFSHILPTPTFCHILRFFFALFIARFTCTWVWVCVCVRQFRSFAYLIANFIYCLWDSMLSHNKRTYSLI